MFFLPFPEQTQKDLYRAALILTAIGIAILLFFRITRTKPEDLFSTCMFYKTTGYYCPGCGGTRAVRALLSGRLFTCFCYHPFVLYTFFMFAWFLSTSTAVYVFHFPPTFQLKLRPVYFYLAALLVLGNCAVKNLLIYWGYWS